MTGNEPSPAQESETDEAMMIRERLSVFALVRTALSSERSLGSWMRTATALYSFGFSLEKFTDYIEKNNENAVFLDGPRRLAFGLVGVGMVSIAIALSMHLKRVKRMRELGLPVTSRFCLATTSAAGLIAIGLATLIGIALN